MGLVLPTLAGVAALALADWAPHLIGESDVAAAWAAARAAQSSVLAAAAPLMALWTAAGMVAGLVGRDAVTAGRGHSSPTGAWLGKHLAAAGLAVVAAWGAGLLRGDAAVAYAGAAVQAAGWWIYLRNLPARL